MPALYAKSTRFVKCKKSKFEKYILWGVPVFCARVGGLFWGVRHVVCFCALGGREVAYHPAAFEAGGSGSTFGAPERTHSQRVQDDSQAHASHCTQRTHSRQAQCRPCTARSMATLCGIGIMAGVQALNACTKRTLGAA